MDTKPLHNEWSYVFIILPWARGSRPASWGAFSVCSLCVCYCYHHGGGYYFILTDVFHSCPCWLMTSPNPSGSSQGTPATGQACCRRVSGSVLCFFVSKLMADCEKGFESQKSQTFEYQKSELMPQTTDFKRTHGDSKVCCPKTGRGRKVGGRGRKVGGKERQV